MATKDKVITNTFESAAVTTPCRHLFAPQSTLTFGICQECGKVFYPEGKAEIEVVFDPVAKQVKEIKFHKKI